MTFTTKSVALAAAIAFGAMAAPVHAADMFGAIAYSPNSGAWGWSKDYASQDEAETRAMDECESRSNGEECQVASWFRNACGSLATGPDGWGADWGNDQWEAAAKALERCSEHSMTCTVKEKICVAN